MKRLLAVTFTAVCIMLAATAQASVTQLYQDVPGDDCGSIDPTTACYEAAAAKKCGDRGTTLDSCNKYCDCVWANQRQQCSYRLACLDTANSEHDACLGHCIVDFN